MRKWKRKSGTRIETREEIDDSVLLLCINKSQGVYDYTRASLIPKPCRYGFERASNCDTLTKWEITSSETDASFALPSILSCLFVQETAHDLEILNMKQYIVLRFSVEWATSSGQHEKPWRCSTTQNRLRKIRHFSIVKVIYWVMRSRSRNFLTPKFSHTYLSLEFYNP